MHRTMKKYKSLEFFGTKMSASTIRKVEKDIMIDEELDRHADNNVREYVEKDEDDYMQVSEDTAILKQNTVQLYQSYNFAHQPNSNLSILSMRHKIVSMIASNSVVIIRGSTGCGKTTQVPQFIFDAEFEKKQRCNIIVTQPSGIAALSIAKRVSTDREWPIGTIVGYEIGLKKNVSRDTRITYCTPDVLLNRLTNKKHMMDYTHIILDEVYERDGNMDFLMLVVRKLLRTNSTTVKVILMSATIDVNKFSTYFSTPMANQLAPAPIIDIPESNSYDISISYINEMENFGGSIPKVDEEPKFTTEMAEFAAHTIHVFDSMDDKKYDGDDNERATVLVFLPGFGEIEQLRTVFLSSKHKNEKWDIIILHSSISIEEQQNIFKKPPKYHRRIILSTNIAESNITVPDVKYVIDFCMTKLLVIKPETNYQCLQLCWASKSNCEQRAGRTGRMMHGKVYRMVPKAFYKNVLPKECLPEMLRASLENVILRTKVLDMGEPKSILALALDPPNLSNIKESILLLKEVGALLNRNMQECDGDLTPLGRVMATLPLNVHLTKLIVLGHLFGVLSDAIILAASMTVENIFENFEYIIDAESIYRERLRWVANSQSDSIACLNAYNAWQDNKTSRYKNNPNEERDWARRYGLCVRLLREMDVFIREITENLRKLGIIEIMSSKKNTWLSLCIDRTFVLEFIIAGAFYPNYFIKFPHNINDGKRDIERTLGGRDPTTTVVFDGWPSKHPGSLYSKRIQEIFGQQMKLKNLENIIVSFDELNRVYIQHEPKNRAPDDDTFVRDCIRMRHFRDYIEVELLNETTVRHHQDDNDDDDNEDEDLWLRKAYTTFMSESFNSEKPSSYRHNMYDEKPYSDLPEESEYRSKLKLQGPFSPLEVHLTHMVTKEKEKMISVEFTSVNSVLLDSCPASSKEFFLVAQNILRNPMNMSHLTLQNTTLFSTMFDGLALLITLIFTPRIELRRSPMGTYYTGALCGLGYDRITEQSLFPDHDLEIIFDVEITMNDLRMINKLRHLMNVAIMNFNRSEIVDDEAHRDMTINCQNQIKSAFKDVMYKTRKKIEPIPVSNFNKWTRYDETLFLVPARETQSTNNVYRLHKALELNERNDRFNRLEEIISNLLKLEALAHQNPLETTIAPIYCKLCLTKITDIANLRAHLGSEQHTAKQRLINTTDEFGRNLQKLIETIRL